METNELIAGYVTLEMAAKKQADHITLLNININNMNMIMQLLINYKYD